MANRYPLILNASAGQLQELPAGDSLDLGGESLLGVKLGDAGVPSISFTGDPDTGLYSPGADQVAIGTGGAGRLFVDADGNVGVGADAAKKFQVARGGGNALVSFGIGSEESSGDTARNFVITKDAAGTDYGANIYFSNHPTVTAGYMAVWATQAQEVLRITSAGVGIGTSSPANLLHLSANNGGLGTDWFNAKNLIRVEDTDDVQSNNQVIGGIVFEGNDTSTGAAGIQAAITANAGIGSIGGGEIRLYTSATNTSLDGTEDPRVIVTSTGNVGIGTTSPTEALNVVGNILATGRVRSKDGTLGDVGLGFTNDHNVGLYRPESDTLGFVTGSLERLRITSAGLVGIGTSSPGARLHVGTAALSGTWSGFFGDNLAGEIAPPAAYGLALGYNRSAGSGEANIAYGTGTGAGLGLIFGSYDGTTYTNRVIFDGAGRVGIGTMGPAATLHVVSADNARTSLFSGATNAIRVTGNNTGIGGGTIEGVNAAASAFAPLFVGGSDLRFGISGTERARVDSSGNVGIGTTNPATKLAVNGYITEDPGDGTYWNVVTQKDIGYAANQVPLNQYLGKMAFVDAHYPSYAGTASSADAAITIDASETERYAHIASFTADRTVQINNLSPRKELILYLRNTNASARTITIQASTTTTGHGNVNLAPGAGTIGAGSVSTVTLAANSGTAVVWIAHISGNIVGGLMA